MEGQRYSTFRTLHNLPIAVGVEVDRLLSVLRFFLGAMGGRWT